MELPDISMDWYLADCGYYIDLGLSDRDSRVFRAFSFAIYTLWVLHSVFSALRKVRSTHIELEK